MHRFYPLVLFNISVSSGSLSATKSLCSTHRSLSLSLPGALSQLNKLVLHTFSISAFLFLFHKYLPGAFELKELFLRTFIFSSYSKDDVNMQPEKIIKILDLQPLLEEGGFYRETYRSDENIPKAALPARYGASKTFGTAIYYLLTPDTCSALHRIPTDEIFHFYLGDSVIMLQLHPDGKSEVTTIGSKIDRGQQLQVIVPKGTWQGSFLKQGGNFALMGVTVSPGFDFSDYEAGDRASLINAYPAEKNLITKLTPPFL